ncbi:hypothetical protein EWH99_13595 [Sporolactobacillus sp. THM7-7]|nr:hypothetical protein EWH99_13595 [Sporolactobacillus sp. THM7-7]
MSNKNATVEAMVKQNNQLRDELMEENKTYYEDLLTYIRTAGLFYDDHEVESLLMQILQDIISAQNNGQSAEEFFGKNPQQAADELIHNLGKASWKEILKLTGLIFGISSFFELLNALSLPGKGINFLVLILNGLLSFFVIGIVFYVLHRSIYAKIIKGKVVSFLVLWLACMLIIGLFVLIQILTPPLLTVYFANPVGILMITILLVGLTVAALRRNKEDRKIWWSFLPPVYIMGLIGILSRLPLTEDWLASSNGRITAAVCIGFGLILNWVITYVSLRAEKE